MRERDFVFTNSGSRRRLRQLGIGQPRSSHTSEDGFTLLELLITTLILPLIMGAIAVMLLGVFKSQGTVSNRILGTADSQVASSLLVKDIQNANYLTTQSTVACGSTGSQILGLRSQGNQVYVSYVLVANGTKTSLFRQLCTGGVTTTPAQSTLLSNNVPGTQTASISCAATVSCTYSTGWIATAGVSNVSMAISETSTDASYSLNAVPRSWNNASAGLAADPFPIAPFTLLGSGSCPQTVLTLSGGAVVSVAGGAGPLIDNSTCAPSVNLSGSAQILASSMAVGNTTPASAVSVSGVPTYPTPTYQAPTGDPLAGVITVPANPTASGTGTCPASGTSGTCTPGNFSSAVSLGGSSNVTFGAGTYVFNQPVTISASAAATFGSGTYLFNGGLTVSGASPVVFNTGTYIFSGTTTSSNALNVSGSGSITAGPGGVLFYVKQGVISFSGAGTISLSGTSQYYGISLWQAASDTNTVTLSGSSAVNAAYGGVYAPKAQIVPSGASIMSASFVVCGSANFSGSAGLYVG